MPSPFPGMDPFIESQVWGDFHTTAITEMRKLLAPRLGERYTAHVERRIYVEHAPTSEVDPQSRYVEADMAIVEQSQPSPPGYAVGATSAAATTIECLLPEPEQRREAFLTIRDSEDADAIVTVLELLSPSNKRRGSDGRRMYLKKRDEVIESEAHLVEVDLLRGGDRMPLKIHSPLFDNFVALVSRSYRRPTAELVTWSMPQRLPIVSIPLSRNDPDVPLDLQTVLDNVYDEALYRRMIKYARPLHPPTDEATQQWIAEQLAAKNIPTPQLPEPRP